MYDVGAGAINGDDEQLKSGLVDVGITAASAIPVGKIVGGTALLWAGTTKVTKTLMAWKVLGNASRGTLVSTALAGKFLHRTIGNPSVSQMTFGLMKRWPTLMTPQGLPLIGEGAPSLGTFIGRNTIGFGGGLVGWGIYDLYNQ